jgi:hypothetical protein
MCNFSLGLLSIATNGYVKYLPDLVASTAKNLKNIESYCHYIFTDDPGNVQKLSKEFPDTNFIIIEIPSLGWPNASLMRYEIYSRHKDVFETELLMHVDSDMYFLSNLEFEVPIHKWVKGMAFVQHPGFFRPLLSDLSNTAIRSRFRAVLVGGYGDWETSKASAAYTPRSLRKQYFCGGAWFGYRKEFLEFCETARINVEKDSKQGIVAKWHDESHLNHLIALWHNPSVLSSRYCYEPKYGKYLKDPILLAVDKATSLEDQLRSIENLTS